jgi:hypothetical protein
MPKPFVYYGSSYSIQVRNLGNSLYKTKHAENNNHVEQICRTMHGTLHEFMAIFFLFFNFIMQPQW